MANIRPISHDKMPQASAVEHNDELVGYKIVAGKAKWYRFIVSFFTTMQQVAASIATAINAEVANRNTAITAAINGEVANRNNAIANAQLTTQKWLASVITKAELPTVPNPAQTYLCRVIKDPAATNNGVWQWIGGGNAWTYFSDNLDFIDETELAAAIVVKVDKVSGKQLSANDYTTTEKNKLAGLSALAPATANALGGIKVGTGLGITQEGLLYTTGGGGESGSGSFLFFNDEASISINNVYKELSRKFLSSGVLTVVSVPSWVDVTFDADNDFGYGGIKLIVQSKSTVGVRSGDIVFTNGQVTKQITITQSGIPPNLNVSVNSITVLPMESGQKSFNITSNTSWEITGNPDWMYISSLNGSSGAQITLNIAPNLDTTSRTATLTVTTTNPQGAISKTVTVTQDGLAIAVSTDYIEVPSSTGQITGSPFTINSNVPWTIIRENPQIVQLNQYEGTGNATIIVSNMSSNSGRMKIGTFTINFGFGFEKTITVAQLGGNAYLSVSPALVKINFNGQNVVLNTKSVAWFISQLRSPEAMN